MNKRVPLLIFFALALILAGCSWLPGKSKAPAVTLDPAALPAIENLVRGCVEEGYTPGAVLLIGIEDRILIRKAYGARMNEPAHEKMTEDTLFDLASLTKATSTSSAILLLAQEGKLSLADPVSKYLPEFRKEGAPEITILQLLTHVSGLPAYTSADKLASTYGPRPNPDGLIQGIAALELKAKPGEKYIYSCLNYLTLARIAQVVAGENMDTYLRRRLWAPLGMKDTTFFPTDEQRARTAPTIYSKTSEVIRRGDVHDPLAYYSACPAYAPGNAGVFSTVDDMSRYCRMMLNGGELDGARIYTPETWALATTNQAPAGLEERSCGWGIWTEEPYATPMNQTPETCCLGHTGYTGTIIWMDKLSRAYVILFTNCVYPTDKEENKKAVIAMRREVIRTVVQNLSLYKSAHPAPAAAAAQPSS